MIQAAENIRVPPRQVGKYLAHIAMVFVVQFAAGKLGDALAIVNSGGIGPVWPASGVALAALLLFGYQVWPGVAAGAFLLAFLSPIPHIPAVVYAAGTTLAALTGTFLLRRVVNLDYSLSRLRDALGMIVFGAFVSSIVSASIGVSVLYAAQVRGWSGFARAWLIYWLGDSMGVLLVTPLVLSFPNLLRIHPRVRISELGALLLLLTPVCFIIFGDLASVPVKLDVLAFAVLPFVIWAAIRFGVSGATLSTLFIASIATAETTSGSGPFAQNTPFTNAVLLDVFFAVLSVSGMTLAAVVAEREQAEKKREQLVREQAAMEARLRLATIVESSDDAIIGEDMDGIITDWNKGAEQLYCYSAGEVIGKPISLLVPPDRAGDFVEIMEALRRGNPVKHYETVRQKKDGTRIEVSLTVSPIIGAEGQIVGASAIDRDITERKRQEAFLRESEERFRLAAHAGKMFAYEWDAATDVIVRSAESSQILGVDQTTDITGQQVLAKVHPDDRERLMAAVAELCPAKAHLLISYRIVRPDGTVIWVERNSRAFFDEQGKLLRMIGMVADITERKRAEERLREYEKAVEASEEMIAVVDREYRYLIANRKFVNLRNKTKEQVVGCLAEEVLNKGVFEAGVKEKLDECFRGSVVRYEMKYTYPELGERDVFVSYFPIEGANGIDRVACILQDITDRKRTEEALRKSEERFRLAAQAGKIYAYEWDVATDKVMRSEEHVNVLGFSDEAKELTRQQLLASVHPDDRTLFRSSVDQVTPENPATRISYRVLRPDGSVVWLEKSARALFDEQGKLLRMIGMVADITERKRAEEALRESEERLRLAVQAGRMYTFEWDTVTDVIIRSSESANILQWSSDPTRDTNRQFIASVHPDDREAYTATKAGLTPEKPTYQITYRVSRPDGVVIWLEDTGRAFFDSRRIRVVGMVADVTDRKVAEEALVSVSRRLIEAQEQERTRIARELHDDFSQRLALLAVELEELHQNPPILSEIRRRMGGLHKQVSQIATDIQTLSHELHSSKLEYLGIAAAMRGFCKEFSEQQDVEIDLRSHDLPGSLSPDVSLCLFRVMQEALHNSAKHSGVRHFEVRLWGASSEIHLTVSDAGAGFDSEAAKESRGIGLISMKERVRLLKGTFSIESQPKRGTTIHARVPLGSDSKPMRATG